MVVGGVVLWLLVVLYCGCWWCCIVVVGGVVLWLLVVLYCGCWWCCIVVVGGVVLIVMKKIGIRVSVI